LYSPSKVCAQALTWKSRFFRGAAFCVYGGALFDCKSIFGHAFRLISAIITFLDNLWKPLTLRKRLETRRKRKLLLLLVVTDWSQGQDVCVKMFHLEDEMKKVFVTLALFAVSFAAVAGDGQCASKTGDWQAHWQKKETMLRKVAWDGINVDMETGKMLVKNCDENSPGLKAGIREGDVLAALDGKSLDNLTGQQLWELMETVKIGQTVTYAVVRDGHTKNVKVTMAPIPEQIIAKYKKKFEEKHTKSSNS
jgi:hypothetical protein